MSTLPPPPPPVPAIRTFTLEADVALPVRTFGSRPAIENPYIETFREMAIGQSFLVEIDAEGGTLKDDCRREANRISSFARRFADEQTNFAVAIRSVSDSERGYGVRVWRVEDRPRQTRVKKSA